MVSDGATRHTLNTAAVIFDMDGVITNTMPDHFRAWKEVLAQEGVHVGYDDVYKREGQRGISSVVEIFREHRMPVTKRQATAILRRKEKLFKSIVKQRFIAGARPLLRHLHKNNFTLALVTGTSRHEVKEILSPALYRLFSVIVTGSDVKNGKPHPEPYQTALRKLNIPASDALVIENAPFGITSARKARIRCIALQTSLPRRYLAAAQYIFPSIAAMRAKITFRYRKPTRSVL